MSIYMTEDEQIEAIKKWWKRYGNIVTISASVLMLAFSGVKYWNWHEQKVTQQASSAYENLMVAYSNHDNKALRGYASQLIKEYGKTVYADAAHLTLAKVYVDKADYSKASAALTKVAQHSKVAALKQIAKIRLSRVLIAQKSYDKALEELADVSDSAYLPVINELKGDIYVALDKYAQAITFYREALNQVQAKGMGNAFLEMKTNEIVARSALS